MSRKTVTIILLLSLGWMAVCAGAKHESLLRDGFFLPGADGKLIEADKKKWVFELDSDLSDGKAVVKAGTKLEFLPSAALENVIAKKHKGKTYRLWGRVTEYKDKNYIFGIYFLAISKADKAKESAKEGEAQKKKRPAINEPNDPLAIPEEIIAKLTTRKIIRTEQLKEGLELKQDSILADRTAFLVEQEDGRCRFVLDGLGRNVGEVSFELLECEELEKAQQQQGREPEQLKFKIAGIVTKFKGEYYLLLQRATKIYSHGNFR